MFSKSPYCKWSYNLHFQIFNNRRGPYHTYDQSSLDAAYNVVKDGMSVCGVARRFDVPVATLRERDRAIGRISLHCLVRKRRCF